MLLLRRYSVRLTLFLVLALLASACQSTPVTTPTADAARPAGAAVSSDMAPTQELRINLSGEPPTLDPNLSSWDAGNAIVDMVFEGLLKFDKDLGLIPGIAREVPTASNGGISADGKTYTFKLREGLRYSDGKPVKAGDVVYSVKRLQNPALAAEYASFYYDIVGAEEYNSSKEKDAARLKALADGIGVSAPDDVTVVFKLKQPRGSFLQLAALWSIYPLREDLIAPNSTPEKPDAWANDPRTYVGNGPFKMTEWVHQDHITLVANENYYGARPKLQKIYATMVADPNANWAAYLNSEREIVAPPVALFEQVQKDPNLKDQVAKYPRLVTFGAQFNNTKAPFDNVKVRQAFATAIDRQAFVDKIRRGIGKSAYSWVPPGMQGHDPVLGSQYKLDPARAKQLLAEAGFPNGQGLPKISYQYANTGNNPVYAQFFQEQWKQNLGVDVALEPMETKAFAEFVNRKEHMIGWFGWSADYPDPDNFLPEIFGTTGGNNKTGYSNPQVDQLMKQAASEVDPARRLQLWGQAQKMIVDEAPMAFIFHDEAIVLVKPYVKEILFGGMDRTSAPGGRTYSELWLAKH